MDEGAEGRAKLLLSRTPKLVWAWHTTRIARLFLSFVLFVVSEILIAIPLRR